MIARVWTAQTTAAQAPAYAAHLQHNVLATLKEVEGYRGAKLLERETDDSVEVIVITFWQSLDAIKQFAGPGLEQAVVSEEAIPLLLEYDQRVKHYEVVLDEVERTDAGNLAHQ